ncbi:MAG: zinc/manganese transport system permease protein [Solirubrobacteraceae bacterium]|jgi:zinc/manganese transport system permease protein|nr:zinc/manganese transport system permease protein [Solirubrobacteraceae bacterium]
MLGQEFVQNALLAGSLIAVASGLVGWFLVLRRQVFAADALSHVAFTGAIAAALLGVDLRLGLFAATAAFAVALTGVGRRGVADDVAIGTAFAWILGLGVLFLAVVATGAGGGDGALAARSLFGSIFGLARPDAELAAAVGAAIIAGIAAIARPLLFASLDPGVAASQGVRVGLLGAGFLVLVGLDAAEATQAVGALLLLGLLAAPAGAAHRLTDNPYRGLLLSAGLAVAATWIGIALSYAIASLPPSSAIIGVAVAIYAMTFAVRPGARRRREPGTPVADVA